MDFEYSPKVQELRSRVDGFMQQHIFPNEHRFHEEVEENTRKGKRWTPTHVVEEMKGKARAGTCSSPNRIAAPASPTSNMRRSPS